jgi:hypothetical protein
MEKHHNFFHHLKNSYLIMMLKKTFNEQRKAPNVQLPVELVGIINFYLFYNIYCFLKMPLNK